MTHGVLNAFGTLNTFGILNVFGILNAVRTRSEYALNAFGIGSDASKYSNYVQVILEHIKLDLITWRRACM